MLIKFPTQILCKYCVKAFDTITIAEIDSEGIMNIIQIGDSDLEWGENKWRVFRKRYSQRLFSCCPEHYYDGLKDAEY